MNEEPLNLKHRNWIPTTDRFVAFLDIMGFKDLVMRKSHAEIYKMMLDISKIKEEILDGFSRITTPEKYKNYECYITSFSDSIIVFSNDNSIISFEAFLITVRYLFGSAIEKQIPIKGAISFGETSVNKSNQIYFGQTIIDAYLLQEDVYYYGVVFHNTIDKYIKENEYKSDFNFYFELKTFLKSGIITHLNLDWFNFLDTFNDKENFVNNMNAILNDFKITCSGYPRKYIDNTIEMFEKRNEKL